MPTFSVNPRESAEERRNKLYNKYTPAIGDESIGAYLTEQQATGNLTYEETLQIQQGIYEGVPTFTKSALAATVGSAADVIGLTTAVGYNLYNMSQGERWAWPEDFGNVPMTTDYYATALGIDLNDPNYLMGSVVGGVAGPPVDAKVIGKLARTVGRLQPATRGSIRALDEAKRLAESGTHRDDIWKGTGWYQGPRGNWKIAISASDAKFHEDHITMLAREQLRKGNVDPETNTIWVHDRTDKIFSHPELFEVFPQEAGPQMYLKLKVIGKGDDATFQITRSGEGSAGSYDPLTGTIRVHSTDGRSTAVHELEHRISNSLHGQAGSSSGKLLHSADQYRIWSYMQRIADKADELNKAGYTFEDVVQLLDDTIPGLDKQAAEYLGNKAMRIIKGRADPEELQDIPVFVERYGRETRRWLEEMDVFEEGEDVAKAILEMDPYRLEALADARYWRDAEEVEARVAQAMRNLTKEQIAGLPQDPFTLFSTMTPERAQELIDQGLDIKPLLFPLKSTDDVIIRKAGVPAIAAAEKVIDAFNHLSDADILLLQKALDEDPTLLAKYIEQLEESGSAAVRTEK